MASTRKTKKSNIPKSIHEMSKEMLQETLKKKRECNAKAQWIVEKFCEAHVDEDWFLANLQFINQCHFDDVTIERAISKICGYPLCDQELIKVPAQQYHISTRYNKVYDITERKNFCSSICFKSATHVKKQLFTSPLWLRDQEVLPKFTVLKSSKSSMGEEVVFFPDKIKPEPEDVKKADSKNKITLNENITILEEKCSNLNILDSEIRLHNKTESNVLGNRSFDKKMNAGNSLNKEIKSNEYYNAGDENFQRVQAEEKDMQRNQIENKNMQRNQIEDKNMQENQIENKNMQRNQIQDKNMQENQIENKNMQENQIEDKNMQENQIKNKNMQRNQIEDKNMHKNITVDKDMPKNKSEDEDMHRNKTKDIAVIQKTIKENPKVMHKAEKTETEIKNKQSDIILKIEKSIFEWFSLDTIFYLYKEEKLKELFLDKSIKIKELLNTKLSTSTYNNKIDKMIQLYGLLDASLFNSNENKKDLKPLPDYSSLKEEGKSLQIKVRAFYQGNLEVKIPKEEIKVEQEENKADSNPIYLPLIDAHAQVALRKKIVLDKLNKVLPGLMRAFSSDFILKMSEVRGLVSTFSLAANNITFKPREWYLIGIIIIKLLCLRDKELESIMRSESSASQVLLILTCYELQKDYLDDLIYKLTVNDNLLEKINEINR